MGTDDTTDDTPDASHLTVIDGGAGDDPPKAKGKRRGGKGRTKGAKLTAKQERFLASLIRNDGRSLSDCYREAYDCSRMSAATVHNEASRLAGHPEVTMRLRRSQATIERSAVSSALSRRRFVLERLEHESVNAANDGARVQALALLGKSTGVDLFTDRVETVDERSASDVRAELERRLAGLLDGTG